MRPRWPFHVAQDSIRISITSSRYVEYLSGSATPVPTFASFWSLWFFQGTAQIPKLTIMGRAALCFLRFPSFSIERKFETMALVACMKSAERNSHAMFLLLWLINKILWKVVTHDVKHTIQQNLDFPLTCEYISPAWANTMVFDWDRADVFMLISTWCLVLGFYRAWLLLRT